MSIHVVKNKIIIVCPILECHLWKIEDNCNTSHLNGVAVKAKDIEIIRLTADSNDQKFVTGTHIFLFDCSRKLRPNVSC